MKKFTPKKNPAKKTARKKNPLQSEARFFVIASIDPKSGRTVYMHSLTPRKWGNHKGAIRFSLTKYANYAAKKCGRKCAITKAHLNNTSEIGDLLRGKA